MASVPGGIVGYLRDAQVTGGGGPTYRCPWTATGDHMPSQENDGEGAPTNEGVTGDKEGSRDGDAGGSCAGAADRAPPRT